MAIPALRDKVLREASRAAKAWTTNDLGGKELARAMYRLNESVEQLQAAIARKNGSEKEKTKPSETPND